MSFRFPDFNAWNNAGTGVRANIPTALTTKAANRSTVTMFWFRNKDTTYEQTTTHVILAKAGGFTGGNDGFVQVNNLGTLLTARLRVGAVDQIGAGTTTVAVELGKSYLVMILSDPVYVHFVVCEPGGSPTVTTISSATPYTTAITDMWTAFGCGTASTAWPGSIEDFNFYLGAFPESAAGVPDATVIQNIANGTTDPTAVAALLGQANTIIPVAASHACRFPMRDETDLAATVGSGSLTLSNINVANGATLYTGGPVRPSRITPNRTRDAISQVTFGTAGDAATAFANIKVEGGSYNGLATLSKMQARLLDEAETVIRDWTDLPTTPPSAGAGTWSESTPFTNVLMAASYMRVEFRAVNSGGTELARETGYGLRGAGFHAISQAQSQLIFLFSTGSSIALPAGLRGVSVGQGEPAVPYQAMLLANDGRINRGWFRGIRQAAIEINTRFPGVPIQIDTYGEPGTAITEHIGVGPYAGRPAKLRTSLGIVQPFYMIFMGHSSGPDASYQTHLTDLVALSEADLGQGIRNLHLSVPRYHGAGTSYLSGNANQVFWSRRGARDFCIANPARNLWMGSWSTVKTGEAGSDPHPSDDNLGQGRSGGLIGWALMSASRAIEDVPLGITAVNSVSGTAVIRFGAVNG
jgi:hypothetical protein